MKNEALKLEGDMSRVNVNSGANERVAGKPAPGSTRYVSNTQSNRWMAIAPIRNDEITSVAPKRVRNQPARPAIAPPATAAATAATTSITGLSIGAYSRTAEPARPPMYTCPSAPRLTAPARNALTRPRPVNNSGAAARSRSPKKKRLLNGPRRDDGSDGRGSSL